MPPMDEKDLEMFGREALMGMRAQSMGRDQNEVVFKMRALSPGLVERYLSTKYIVTVQGEEVILRIGKRPPKTLNAACKARSVKNWSIVTAYNPYSVEQSEAENISRQVLLTKILDYHGYDYQPAYGRSEDELWIEPSLLVFGISYDIAKSLGTCFQQNAIVFGQAKYQIELVLCDKEWIG